MVIDQHNNMIISQEQCKFEIGFYEYHKILELTTAPTEIYIGDHLGGFNTTHNNPLFDHLDAIADSQCTVWGDQIFNNTVQTNYPKLKFKLNFPNWLWKSLSDYNIHPDIQYKNFLCSFNGSAHVGRKLLVSILKKFGYFNLDYCSKNFAYSTDTLFGHIKDYVDNARFFKNFFISRDNEHFFQSVNSFGHMQYNHDQNIYNLESKLTESFLHIVSETLSTSYHPFITEKFLYSVVTRGLFLAYAQPGWHAHLEKYYGFKRYTKIFDYRFDDIQNPVERLLELITMISKFSQLTPDEWKDLHLLEQDTIEYNYNHYYNKNYLEWIKKYDSHV